jgi:hypothetical protein
VTIQRLSRLKRLARYPKPHALALMSTKAPATRSNTRTLTIVSLTSWP